MTAVRPGISDKRKAFFQLHQSGCFVIPNPWDVGSARFLQSAGFKEKGAEGVALEREIQSLLRQSDTRLIGPNCLGLMNPWSGLNATFAQDIARPIQQRLYCPLRVRLQRCEKALDIASISL